MQYLITFLEGMITFISPCVLPMLPVYALYFTAGEQEGGAGRALTRGALPPAPHWRAASGISG